MKWLFLVNNIDLMMEFLGKLAHHASTKGDECVLVCNSKMAEYRKVPFFPKESKVISKVDWLAAHYDKATHVPPEISWKEFFATFERKADLINLDYQHSAEIIQQLYQFFEFVFATEKPDIVVNEAPANIFNSMAYYFCQKHNVPYIGFIGSKFKDKIDVYDKPHTLSLYEKTFKILSDKDISSAELKFAKTFIEDFTSHKKLPPYMDFQFEFSRLQGPLRYLKRQIELAPHYIRYLKGRNLFSTFDYESESTIAYNIWRPLQSLVREIRAIYYKKKYKPMDTNDQFFMYPLHFHPEASTLVLATYFSDQLNTIKNIAFSLPFPYKLYVKEHPIALGTHSADFYKHIKKLPNVVLIAAHENNKNLIEKSHGIITLTSTVGMEAALLGKPVYILGDVFYEYHPLCIKVKSFQELQQKIYEIMVQEKKSASRESDRRFIVSYFKHTVPGDVVQASKAHDTNNYPDIYESVTKIISLL